MGEAILTRRPGGGSTGPSVVGNTYDAIVKSGSSVIAGDMVQWDIGDVIDTSAKVSSEQSSAIYDISYAPHVFSIKLTDYKYIRIARRDSDKYCVAVLVTISGTTITLGTPVVIASEWASYTAGVALSPSKVIVAYTDTNNYGKAVLLYVEGTNIYVSGSPVTITTGGFQNVAMTRVSANHAVVAYTLSLDTGPLSCRILYIADNAQQTIQVGSENYISGAITQPYMVGLYDYKFMAVFNDAGSLKVYIAIVNSNANTLSNYNTVSLVSSLPTSDEPGICRVSDTQALIGYRNASQYPTLILVTSNVGAVTATGGTPVVVLSLGSTYVYPTLDSIGENTFILRIRRSTTGIYVVRISGSTITVGSVNLTDIASVNYTTYHVIDDTYIMESFIYSKVLYARLYRPSYLVYPATSDDNVRGIAVANAGSGENVQIISL